MGRSERLRASKKNAVLFFLVSLLVSASPIEAGRSYRGEIVATRGGERVRGALACFQRAEALDDALELWFSTSRETCLSADQVFDLPEGYWNFRVEHPAGLTSNHPGTFAIRGQPGPGENDYRAVESPLEEAAAVDLEDALQLLLPGEELFLFFPNTGTKSAPWARPVQRDDPTVLVPLGSAFYVVYTNQGMPVAWSPRFESGIDIDFSSSRMPAGIAWWELHGEARQSPKYPFEDLRMPEIKAESVDGDEFRAEITYGPRIADSLDGFFVFRTSPGVEVRQFVMEGGGFVTDYVSAKRSGELFLGVRPLSLIPAARLEIEDVPISLSSSSCYASGIAKPEICVNGDCSEALSAELEVHPSDETVVTLKSSIPELNCSGIARDLLPGVTKRVRLDCGPLLQGFVARAGVGFPALLRLNGVETVSDSLGRFVLPLDKALSYYHVEATECGRPNGTTYQAFDRQKVLPGGTLFIDFPQNRLEITVTDRRGEEIEKASVRWAAVMKDDPEVAYFTASPEDTDAEGKVSFQSLPIEHGIVVCAEAEGFQRKCSTPLEVGEGERSAEVRLDREAQFKIQVLSSNPGVRVWAVAGREQLFIPIDDDGVGWLPDDFRWRTTHFVLASPYDPLTVVGWKSGSPENDEVRLAFSDTARSIKVQAPSWTNETVQVLLDLDERPVPQDALTFHLMMRGFSPYLQDTELELPEIGTARQVKVYLWDTDVLPQLTEISVGSLPWRMVSSDGVALFEADN